jgi:hypothetical protein
MCLRVNGLEYVGSSVISPQIRVFLESHDVNLSENRVFASAIT